MAIVFVRTLILYFVLLLTMRLMGKRQLGEMELSEFVVAALIADLASVPLEDAGIAMINGLVPIITLFCCEVLIAGLSMKSIKLRTLLFGRPGILIDHGRILQKEMHKNRFTVDELMQELRSQGYLDLSKIAYAILETDGKLSIIKIPAESPPTAATLGMRIDDRGYPHIVISDGRILSENLHRLQLDEQWLHKQLADRGMNDPREVFLMTVDDGKNVFLVEKEEEK